jgi:hypothetical protein
MTIKTGTVAAVLMFSMIAIPNAFGQDYGPAKAHKALVVVDSRGQVVGPLVFPGTNQFTGSEALPVVAFAVNGTQLSLRVARDFLCGGVNVFSSRGCSGVVWYTTPDCTGQPYLL